ncbi:phosphoenolpyruvate carboxykinase [GTP]-like isoform X2 [Onthophagus taurus]|uniref:phosphoenolpyruvate carboxykinase [GTP]-like isoform X2 n=1 Tax=Onthophagus taurus TaxID=166361 RepID=UPI0039BE4288
MPDETYSFEHNLFIYDDSRTKNITKFKALLKNAANNYLDNKQRTLEITTENSNGYSTEYNGEIVKKINAKIIGVTKQSQRYSCYEKEEDTQVQQVSFKNDVTTPIKKYENSYLLHTNLHHHAAHVEPQTFISTLDIYTPLLKPEIESEAISTIEHYNKPKYMEIPYMHSKIVIELTESTYVTFPLNTISNMVAKFLDDLNDDNFIMMTISSFNHENPSIPCHPEYTMFLQKSELNLNDNKELIAFKSKEEWFENQMLIMSTTNYQNKKMDVAASFYSVDGKGLKVKYIDDNITHFDNKDGIQNGGQLENCSSGRNNNEELLLLTSTNEPPMNNDIKVRIENDEDQILFMPNTQLPVVCKYWPLILYLILCASLLLYYFFFKNIPSGDTTVASRTNDRSMAGVTTLVSAKSGVGRSNLN